MAIKHLVSPGIGFSPGSIKYIVTRGLISKQVVVALDRVAFVLFTDPRALVGRRDNEAFVKRQDRRSKA